MKVTDLAKSLETTADTVRFYTKLGLLEPIKAANGYKSYNSKDKDRLQFILSARQLGFTVADVTEIIAETKKGKTACPLARQIIKDRMEETERQYQAMSKLRQKMKAAIISWELEEDKAPTSHTVCHLIEQFSAAKT